MNIKEILKALSPLKRLMIINTTVKYLVLGFLIAGGGSLIFSVLALITPIVGLVSKILYIYIAAFFIGSIASLVSFPII